MAVEWDERSSILSSLVSGCWPSFGSDSINGIGILWQLLPLVEWPAGIALFLVTAEIFLTRGLHLDGLADWADSIGGFHHKEKRLVIMREVHLGTFGVLTLILALIGKLLLFERLLSSESLIWILAIFALSRGMMVELITTIPYSRAGEGIGKVFVKGATKRHRIASHILSLTLCGFYGPFGFFAFWTCGVSDLASRNVL